MAYKYFDQLFGIKNEKHRWMLFTAILTFTFWSVLALNGYSVGLRWLDVIVAPAWIWILMLLTEQVDIKNSKDKLADQNKIKFMRRGLVFGTTLTAILVPSTLFLIAKTNYLNTDIARIITAEKIIFLGIYLLIILTGFTGCILVFVSKDKEDDLKASVFNFASGTCLGTVFVLGICFGFLKSSLFLVEIIITLVLSFLLISELINFLSRNIWQRLCTWSN